jgi:hypothetical protein
MGRFTQVQILIECHTEEGAKEVANSLFGIEALVQEMHDESVGMSAEKPTVDGITVEMNLSSDRFPNAEWQAEQVLDVCKRKHKSLISEFTADDVTAENMIYETDWDD